MSFKSYALSRRDDGSIELTDPHPVMFSGPQGLIAKFVRAEPARAGEPWKLLPAEVHALVPLPGSSEDRLIVFEQTAENTVELQWLQSISGVSAGRTEMMFSFRPLATEPAASGLRVRVPAINRTYAEELTLDGGVLAPNGPWRWCSPHLSLGGVVLQRSPS